MWLRWKFFKLRNPNLFVTTSFHKLASVYQNKENYTYAFLGTIFDQVSEKFNSGYNETSLGSALQKANVPIIARGGTSRSNIELCQELGFSGMAFYGSVWKKENPVEAFCDILSKCRELNIKIE